MFNANACQRESECHPSIMRASSATIAIRVNPSFSRGSTSRSLDHLLSHSDESCSPISMHKQNIRSQEGGQSLFKPSQRSARVSAVYQLSSRGKLMMRRKRRGKGTFAKLRPPAASGSENGRGDSFFFCLGGVKYEASWTRES